MQVRYEKVGRTSKNRFTGEMREPIDRAYYICQTYNRLGKNACTSHKIEARDLYNLVLKDIQELAAQAMKDLKKKKSVSILGHPVRRQVRLVKLLPVDTVMDIWCKQQGIE